jgi:hypothetical protein
MAASARASTLHRHSGAVNAVIAAFIPAILDPGARNRLRGSGGGDSLRR